MTDLSARGASLVHGRPTMPGYLLAHFAHSTAPYDRVLRPDGYIPMCIAENKLVTDLLVARLAQTPPLHGDALGYADMVGPLPFRQDLAAFLQRWVLGRAVDPAHLAVLGGAGSVLETLFYVLADPGDGVLVPTPSYAGFWMDLETRDALRIVPVQTRAAEGWRLTPALLDAAGEAANVPIRALLFTSPNNPIGTVYSAHEIQQIADWARSNAMHVIFDEVYALSVFGDQPFTSAAAVLPSLGDHVHLVWAFSKDLAASGLRCGTLISENADVLAAVNALSYWACCSGATLHLLQQLITDHTWLGTFVPTMQQRLGNAYRTVTDHLTRHGIPFVPGGAGFFVLVDLRARLESPTFAAEEALWQRLLDEAQLNLTPGSAMRSAEPGLFRLCFASVPPDVLQVGLDRLTAVLSGVSPPAGIRGLHR